MTAWEDGDRTLHRRTDLQDRRDVRNATGWFDRVAEAFRTFGWDTVAENLRRYRSGTGEPKIYSRNEIERHAPILMAEDRSRTRFETGTLFGRTDNQDLNKRVLEIADGQTETIDDHWDAEFFPPAIKDYLWDMPSPINLLMNPGTYAAFGRGRIRSTASYKLNRSGNRIIADGDIVHTMGERPADHTYDFNPGQPGHSASRVAEAASKAAPFTFGYRHAEKNRTVIRINPDGSRVVERSVWWPDEQHQ